MATHQTHLTLPKELVDRVDVAAKEEFASRSEFIRQAIVERLKVIDECRAKLASIAKHANPPAEAELYDLLRLKHQQREVAKWRKEWRRSIRERAP
jgi:metal-responsive CopG/Arc/MetJ family transcriptional regulator